MNKTGAKNRLVNLELYRRRVRDRSVESVKLAIEEIVSAGKAVTLAAIVATTKSLATQGHDGVVSVSHSTVLRNEGCRELFDAAKTSRRRRRRALPVSFNESERAKAARLMRLDKRQLVERILELEERVSTIETQATALRATVLEFSLGGGCAPPI